MSSAERVDGEAQESASARKLPSGVWGMAATELWERFSFYGLQGILSFYLLFSLTDGGLEMNAAVAASIVGAYGGSVYIAQILGGWLGGRVVCPSQMVLYGAIIITVGHIALAVGDGLWGLGVGLALIVAGTGALKTNITSIVGFVLDEGKDEARDVGFSYFYIAINIGAVAGPLSTGFVHSRYGFHWGFALAAIGMVFALMVYLRKRHALPARARMVENPLPPSRYAGLAIGTAVAVGVVVIAIRTGIINEYNATTVITVIALTIAAGYFGVMLSSKSITAAEKSQIKGYLPLFVAAGIPSWVTLVRFRGEQCVDLR